MEDFPLLTSLKLNVDVFLRIVLHSLKKVGFSSATMQWLCSSSDSQWTCWRKQLLPILHVGFGFCCLEKEVDAFGQTWATEHLSKLEHCGAFLLHHCPFWLCHSACQTSGCQRALDAISLPSPLCGASWESTGCYRGKSSMTLHKNLWQKCQL